MGDWLRRRDSALPWQDWRPFPPEAIVQARSQYWPDIPDTIAPAKSLDWGYARDFGMVGEGVIMTARRLDKPLAARDGETG